LRNPLVVATLLTLTSQACRASEIADPGYQAADTTIITVDYAATLQRVDGFGGTTLSLVYPNGDHLGSYRPAAIKAAFGGVGLSLGLLNLGVVETPAGGADLFGRRANDNPDPFLIDPAGFDFTGSELIRDKVLAPAEAFGYTDLTLGPLLNLRGPLSWMQPIRSTDYQRYLDEAAEHVLAIMLHWRDADNRTPRLLQLFNEPTTGNSELQSSSIQEVVDLVKRIGERLRAAGFGSVKFLVPNEETIGRSLEVARAILGDPQAGQFVGAIGYHPYPYGSVYVSVRRILETSGSGEPDATARQQLEQLKALGQQYGVPVWMTEVTEGPGTEDYAIDAIENVLARAIHIHDNFEYAGASAFFGMQTIWDSQTHEEHFAGRNVPFLSDHSSIILADVRSGTIHITGMGYAIGHYAHWIRPGALRVATSSNRPRVLVSSFRDAADGHLVVVAVNNEPTAQALRIQLTGATAKGPVTGEESYASLRWRIISPFAPAANGEIEFVAPARSVVTLAIPVG